MTAEFGHIQFDRRMNATPDRVFQALTHPQDRMAWGAPDTASVHIIEGSGHLEAGARETARVGPRDNPYVDLTTDWVILEAPHRLVYAETLSADGSALSASLATFELAEDGGATALRATIQIANFAGPEMQAEIEAGWSHAMDALGNLLG